MSSQEETEEILALLESDEEDDELLSCPGLLDRTKVTKKKSPPSTNSTAMPTSATAKTICSTKKENQAPKTKKVLSEEELKEKAHRIAAMALSDKQDWRYMDLDRLDQVKWQVVNKKKKRRVFPCYIVENHNHATALSGHEEEASLKLTERNNTLIRFVGHNCTFSDSLQVVPASQLRAFDDENDSSNKTKSSGSGSDSDNNDQPNYQPPKWNADLMQQYLGSIQSQKIFSAGGEQQDGAKNLCAEQIYLELFLDFVRRKQQQAAEAKKAKAAAQQAEEEEDETSTTVVESLGKGPSPSSHSSNPMTQDSGDDNDDSTVKEMVPARPHKAPRPGDVKRPDTLRAGDMICYCPEQKRFGKETMVEARVVKIDARSSDGFHITTSRNDHLRRGHQIKIVARFIRNKLARVHDACFDGNLKLTSGSFDDAETKSDQMAELYRQTQEQLTEVLENKHENSDAATRTASASASTKQSLLSSSSQGSLGGKRKAAPTSNNGKDDSEIRRKTQKPSPKWRVELEALLQKNREAGKQRRVDKEKLSVEARALETAIAVRSSSSGSVEELQQEQDSFAGFSTDQLSHFLTGNRNKLLPTTVLRELTQAWETWLFEKNKKEPVSSSD